MIRFVIGVVLILAALCGAIVIEGGSLLAYMAVTSFMIAVIVPIFAELSVWKGSEWRNALVDAFRPTTDKLRLEIAVRIWRFFEKASYIAGVLGLIVGVILVLSTIRDMTAIGKPLGVCLLSPLYGTVLGLVAYMLKSRVEYLQLKTGAA